jgi:protein-disulfide isomerase
MSTPRYGAPGQPAWRLFRWFGIFCWAAASSIAAETPTECLPISDSVREQIAQYLSAKYGLVSSHIELVRDVVLDRTCYAKVVGESSDGIVASVYLSPDRRFVVDSVFDLSGDPLADERRRRAALSQDLSAGHYPSLGNVNAAVTVVLFSDFQCPYCKKAAEVLRQVVSESPSNVRVIFRNYPLRIHGWALPAARAAACAFMQDEKAFWTVHDSLFERQSEVTGGESIKTVIEALLRQHEIDMAQFERCMTGAEGSAIITADIRAGRLSGVRSTPTLFINGIRREGLQNAEELRTLIREAGPHR